MKNNTADSSSKNEGFLDHKRMVHSDLFSRLDSIFAICFSIWNFNMPSDEISRPIHVIFNGDNFTQWSQAMHSYLKKRCVDNNSGEISYMLYARALFITWGTREHWDWNCFKETGEENIEVARLSHVCWLDVRGKLKMSELSPGVSYDVFYQVKLRKGGSGWELPITLRLSLPDGRVQHRQVSLLRKPRGEWMELNVGNFQAQRGEDREVCFDLYEHGGHWKNGLIVKAAILRPRADKS